MKPLSFKPGSFFSSTKGTSPDTYGAFCTIFFPNGSGASLSMATTKERDKVLSYSLYAKDIYENNKVCDEREWPNLLLYAWHTYFSAGAFSVGEDIQFELKEENDQFWYDLSEASKEKIRGEIYSHLAANPGIVIEDPTYRDPRPKWLIDALKLNSTLNSNSDMPSKDNSKKDALVVSSSDTPKKSESQTDTSLKDPGLFKPNIPVGRSLQDDTQQSYLPAPYIAKIKAQIEKLEKEIASCWPYPNKDRKQEKVDGLNELLKQTLTKTVNEAIVEVEKLYPNLRKGSISTRTSDLLDEISRSINGSLTIR